MSLYEISHTCLVTTSPSPSAALPLKKRHHALAYHRVREAIAAGFLAFYHIDGDKNPADILSKHWAFVKVWPMLKSLLFWRGETIEIPGVVATSKKEAQDKGE